MERRRQGAARCSSPPCRDRGALMRQVTFLRPTLGEGFSADAMTPLVFAILKARTPSTIATTMIDERVEPLRMMRTDPPGIVTDAKNGARRLLESRAANQRRISANTRP